MADVRISDLTAASPALDTMLLEVDNSGASNSVALSVLSAWIATTYAKRVKRYGYGDVNQVIPNDARVASLTAALTAARTWTLPAASAFAAGETLKILDEAGGIGATNTLTIAHAGSDTINGATTKVLSSARAEINLESDGVSAWSYEVKGLGQGGTGQVATSNNDLLQKLGLTDSSGKVLLANLPAAIAGAMQYQGTWNATTNNPALSSGAGSKGYFYKVSVTGTTTLDGISQWNVGDMALFDGTVWDKIDGIASEVLSVAGLTGAITAAALKTAIAIVATDVTDSTAVGRSLLTAASAGAARGNLGAAASGANTDILSLGGLTTPLSVAQGGTGSTTGPSAAAVNGARAISGTDTIIATDKGKVLNLSGTFTLGATAAATLGANFYCYLKKTDGSGVVTFDPNASETVNGLASIAVYQESFMVWTDGANWFSQGRKKGWVPVTSVSLTGQTLANRQITEGFGDAEFSKIHIDFDNLTFSAGQAPNLRIVKNGAVIATSTYGFGQFNMIATSSGGSAPNASNQSNFPLTTSSITTSNYLLGSINFGSLGAAAGPQSSSAKVETFSGPNAQTVMGWMTETTVAAVQGVQITPASGTIASIEYSVMGYRA